MLHFYINQTPAAILAENEQVNLKKKNYLSPVKTNQTNDRDKSVEAITNAPDYSSIENIETSYFEPEGFLSIEEHHLGRSLQEDSLTNLFTTTAISGI